VAFRPSEAHVDRSRELLYKNRKASSVKRRESELDQMEHVNHLMTLLKAEARKISTAQRKS